MTAQSLSAQTGSVKPRVRGLKSLLTHQTFRRLSQIFFLALIAFFAIQHNVVVLIAVLVTALFTRSAFCGWICPLGFLQDLVSNLSTVLQKRIPGLRRTISSLKKRGARLAVLDRYLRYFKYLVQAWAVGGSAYFGVMIIRVHP